MEMGKGQILAYEVKKGFGDPSKRTLSIDDSEESEAAVSFLNELGVSFTIEHVNEAEENREVVFPNILIGKNGTCLRGLDIIKFFRWELQPTIRESEDDPSGAEEVIRLFEKVDEKLKVEGFFEKMKDSLWK